MLMQIEKIIPVIIQRGLTISAIELLPAPKNVIETMITRKIVMLMLNNLLLLTRFLENATYPILGSTIYFFAKKMNIGGTIKSISM